MSASHKYRRRWSDNDKHFGPFTYARDRRYRPFAAVINSGCDEYPGAYVRFSAFGHTVIIGIPTVIKPWRNWVDTSHYEWSKPNSGGYWDIHAREYGFSYSEGFLQVFLGPQTHDSDTTKSWSKHLPWTQWRFIRHSLYGAAGEHVWTGWESARLGWDAGLRAKDDCPSVSFKFTDFDGELIDAKTRVEEREWHFGTGCFKWLSWFRRAKISRYLDIEFAKETGRRKGSWKGGTLGHSINMKAGELHEAAFRRYCAEHDMTFMGPASHPLTNEAAT